MIGYGFFYDRVYLLVLAIYFLSLTADIIFAFSTKKTLISTQS